jgi:hypothetical protein
VRSQKLCLHLFPSVASAAGVASLGLAPAVVQRFARLKLAWLNMLGPPGKEYRRICKVAAGAAHGRLSQVQQRRQSVRHHDALASPTQKSAAEGKQVSFRSDRAVLCVIMTLNSFTVCKHIFLPPHLLEVNMHGCAAPQLSFSSTSLHWKGQVRRWLPDISARCIVCDSTSILVDTAGGFVSLAARRSRCLWLLGWTHNPACKAKHRTT